jgi:MOSC domain-containing protein YiiM
MQGIVVGLHVNPEGGVPKSPVPSLAVETNGCVGDLQRNLKHHGGPKRAVCLMTTAVMKTLQREGHPIGPGTTGENVLIDGISSEVLREGLELHLGSVVLRITSDAPPCKTIRASFIEGGFKALSHQQHAGRTRWYAEVLVEGTLRLGDEVLTINEDGQAGNP